MFSRRPITTTGVGFAELEQNLGDLVAALAGRQEQRRLVVLVLGVDVRVEADQRVSSFLVVDCRRPVQGCSAYKPVTHIEFVYLFKIKIVHKSTRN